MDLFFVLEGMTDSDFYVPVWDHEGTWFIQTRNGDDLILDQLPSIEAEARLLCYVANTARKKALQEASQQITEFALKFEHARLPRRL